MAFKSEIHVAELASIKTGHTEGDIYYILDNGMLGDIPCKPGSFVKWHNNAWQILSGEHYALASDVDGEVAEAVGDILDDGSTSETVVVSVPSSQAGDYEVGKYYKVQNGVAKLRTKTVGESVTELTFDTQSGVLEAINDAAEALIATYNVTNYAAIKAAYDAGKRIILVADTPNDPDDIVIADLFYYHVATGEADKDSFSFVSIYRDTKFRFTITDPATWSRDTSNVADIEVFDCTDGDPFVGPSVAAVTSAVNAGKNVILRVAVSASSYDYYTIDGKYQGMGGWTCTFIEPDSGKTLTLSGNGTWRKGTAANIRVNIAAGYSDLTFPIAEGTQCTHDGRYYYCSASGGIASQEDWTPAHWTQTSVAEQIGNVEALLAAL